MTNIAIITIFELPKDAEFSMLEARDALIEVLKKKGAHAISDNQIAVTSKVSKRAVACYTSNWGVGLKYTTL